MPFLHHHYCNSNFGEKKHAVNATACTAIVCGYFLQAGAARPPYPLRTRYCLDLWASFKLLFPLYVFCQNFVKSNQFITLYTVLLCLIFFSLRPSSPEVSRYHRSCGCGDAKVISQRCTVRKIIKPCMHMTVRFCFWTTLYYTSVPQSLPQIHAICLKQSVPQDKEGIKVDQGENPLYIPFSVRSLIPSFLAQASQIQEGIEEGTEEKALFVPLQAVLANLRYLRCAISSCLLGQLLSQLFG